MTSKVNHGPYPNLTPYAAYLLRERIDDYTRESLRLSFEVNIPLLNFFRHLSMDELFSLSKRAQVDFLGHLSKGDVKGHIEASLNRWLSDQLPLFDRYDVVARDLTLAFHVRSKILKHFILDYTDNMEELIKIRDQIDDLILEYNTATTDVYIKILKDKVQEESNFSTNIINASPGITFIYDLEQKEQQFIKGPGLLNNMSYETGEPLLFENIHPEDKPGMEDFLNEVASGDESKTYHTECRISNNMDEYQWFRCYAVVYKRNANGKPSQLLGVCYDISQEKEMAVELKKREKQLLEAQAIAQIGSYEWDIINDESVSTPELQHIFEADHRQSLEEMMSHTHQEDKEMVRLALEEAYKTGTYHCEFRYNAKSGQKVIHSRGVVSYNQEKKPQTLIGTVQDITKRKRVEESLLQKTIELEHTNEQLRQYAYVASHDMKEPLRKIAMFSDLIITSDWDNLSEKTKVNLQKITDASKRMQQLIEGILSYSSLSVDAEKETFSLETALQESINNLEFRITETNAIIESDGLPQAEVIPFQMQQLFQNLLANALKFSKKDTSPRIMITHACLPKSMINLKNLQSASKYLRLEIADNGIGFNNQVSEKIFDLFQRLHSKSTYEGSGLGLAICKRIVEYHGGVIYATSQEGIGSRFVVVLPVTGNGMNHDIL